MNWAVRRFKYIFHVILTREYQGENMKKVLFVEDDFEVRRGIVNYLRGNGWIVSAVTNYEEAIGLLSRNKYSALLLDKKIDPTIMNANPLQGDEFIEMMIQTHYKLPPIIVLSAYLSDELKQWLFYLGVDRLLDKPVAPPDIENYLEMVVKGTHAQQPFSQYLPDVISRMVQSRETNLKTYIQEEASKPYIIQDCTEPYLIVGRRWNSWYPTLFNVPGGAYVIVAPPADQAGRNDVSPITQSFIIDPGFKLMDVLKSIDFSIKNVKSCIISHNHPDHLGAVFEYMAAMNALGVLIKIYCNTTVAEMLRNLSGSGVIIETLSDQFLNVIEDYKSFGNQVRIQVKAFSVTHKEIGISSNSLGLIVRTRYINKSSETEDTDLVILGDTEYNHADHYISWMPVLCASTVKIVILHIGSAQMKEGSRKHLYLEGAMEILRAMDIELTKTNYRGKLLVLLSEWGLEHATGKQIENICGKQLPTFNEVSPIVETVKTLSSDLKKIDILPADIGLRIGLLSGNVYLGRECVNHKLIKCTLTDNGIEYKHI